MPAAIRRSQRTATWSSPWALVRSAACRRSSRKPHEHGRDRRLPGTARQSCGATSRWAATSPGAPAARPTASTCPRTSTTWRFSCGSCRRRSRFFRRPWVESAGARRRLARHRGPDARSLAPAGECARPDLRRSRRRQPEGRALRGAARPRGRRVPRRRSRDRGRRARHERRLLRRRDLGHRRAVATIDRQGRIVQRGRDEYDLGYRHCALKTRGRGMVRRSVVFPSSPAMATPRARR